MLHRIITTPLVCLALAITLFAQSASNETVIHNFHLSGDTGTNPTGSLFMDQAGNFYGSALSGTIFEFSPNSSGGWNYSALTSASSYPNGSLAMDRSGNLYASTYWGEVYQYSQGGSGWTATLLYTFNGASGNGPSPLIVDAAGNLYGTYGSGGSHGYGYVFELSPSGKGNWSLTDLHDFNGTDGAVSSANDAGSVLAGLVMDASGNLYGTAGQGGSSQLCTGGCGVVFKLSKTSGTWTETVLHNFKGSDGENPDAALLLDASGNLYGTTTAGGADGFGVVFETSKLSGQWTTKVLHSFTNMNGDGAYPNSTLVMDSAGSLYGATEAGGGSVHCTVFSVNGCGAIFELEPSGATWKETILGKFSGEFDGGFPGGVILGKDGNLYGVAQVGGTYNGGLFFEFPR